MGVVVVKSAARVAAVAAMLAPALAGAAPVTFGTVTVDSTTGPGSVVVNGPGRSGTFLSYASSAFAGVTTLGQAAGGWAGDALFIGERFGPESPEAVRTPTSLFLSGSVEVTLGATVFNNPGADLALFVSGQLDEPSNPNSFGFKETVAVRTLGSTGAYWYADAIGFTSTLTSGSNVYGYFTYLYDLTDLGLAPLAGLTGVEIANFSPWATVTGGSGDGRSGVVDPTGLSGVAIAGGLGKRFTATGQYEKGYSCTAASVGIPDNASGNSYCLERALDNSDTFEPFDTDPDLLYVAGLSGSVAPVPLPAALPLMVAGLGALVVAGRRRRV